MNHSVVLTELPGKHTLTAVRKIWAICAALFLISQIFFLINIQFPRGHNFDEFHYVPSAKQYLEWKDNQNWEHPPLAKMIMAAGIGVWGDRPIGWRYMSTVFGSLTLIAMYLWAFAIFGDEEIAIWVAGITFFNQLLYVQARIGMLDTFMFAFIAWAMWAYTLFWKKRDPQMLYLAGMFLGLGTACKWFTIIPWALCVGLIGLTAVFEIWNVRFTDPRKSDWFQPDQWKSISAKNWILGLVVIPFLVYYVTFIPLLAIQHKLFNIGEFFSMQARMWDGQGRVVNSHPYMSTWTQWPMLTRPIWYAFDKEGATGEFVRGVILLGNPIVMWGGLVALIACAWGWLVDRRRDAFLILSAYVAFFASWMIIPRKVAFFYYYYPAGMTLSLALAYAFYRGPFAKSKFMLWLRWGFFGATVAFFVYFFPISAALKIPGESFRHWMWFRSWI